jgi:hypothetical protein
VEAWAPEESSFCGFTPEHIGVYADRFLALAQGLGEAEEASDALRQIEDEYIWASNQRGAIQARDKYRAALSIMSDLLSQGWVWRFRQHRLELAPPDFTTPARTPEDVRHQKEKIRQSMLSERLAQMQTPSTVRFLEDMERPRGFGGQRVSQRSRIRDTA